MKQDEFRYRYIVKVGSSIAIALLNMIIQFILPRALSVEEYGYYTYNLNVFTSVVMLANLSTSNAFIAKYSKRNQEIGLIYFYLKFFAIVALGLNIAVFIFFKCGISGNAFAGQTIEIVLLGLEASIISKLLTDCISIYDAAAISRFPAILQIILKMTVSVVIVLGYFANRLDLTFFYITQTSITFLIIVILLYAIIMEQKRVYQDKIVHSTKEYIREFYVFCKPLVLAIIVAQIFTIIMNWALMKWAGAVEQAMFGAAWQLNTLVAYVFSPYAELSKREFAIVSSQKKILKIKVDQAMKLMVWLTSYFAIFIAVNADWILPIIYGNKYNDAIIVTGIIMVYTIYQAWGQIAGAYMIALEKTKVNAVISILGQVMNLIFVILFQMPNVFFPNSLGAMGIALNYLLANMVTSCVSVIYIYVSLEMSSRKIMLNHLVSIALCSISAILLRYMCNALFFENALLYFIVKILISGLIYTCIFMATIFIKPELIGVNKITLTSIFKSNKINRN